MSQKTQLIIIIGIAVVFFALGYAFSFYSAPVNENSFQAGWEAAKTRLIDSGFIMPGGVNAEIRGLNGEIKEINGDKITLKIRPLEPLADESLDVRIIVVDSATKIYVLETKDLKEYLAEMNTYAKKIQDGKPIASPDRFKKSEISLSDLKVGQRISVTAEKNIKEIKEFNAIEINYNKLVVPIAPVPATAPKP